MPFATTSNAEVETLKITIQQLEASLKKLKTNRASSESENSKKMAILTGRVATLSRAKAELEEKLESAETSLESSVLETETFKNNLQTLEERVEELTMDLEMKELEKDELAEELEDAKMSVSTAPSTGGADADATEEIVELKTQNRRFKDALLKLRNQSSSEKQQLTKDLNTASQKLASTENLAKQLDELQQFKDRSKEEISLLKSQIDAADAYESMVEEMTEKNLKLEEEVANLTNSIR